MPPEQLIPLLVIPVVLVITLLKNRRKRELRPERLWIIPLIVTCLILFGLWGMHMSPRVAHTRFGLLEWALLAGGLVLGSVTGWWRGKTITIERTGDGRLMAQASSLGLIILLAIFAGRRALEALLASRAVDWHLNLLALTDAFMLMAVGLIVFQRVEMFIRARRIRTGGTDSHLEVTA